MYINEGWVKNDVNCLFTLGWICNDLVSLPSFVTLNVKFIQPIIDVSINSIANVVYAASSMGVILKQHVVNVKAEIPVIASTNIVSQIQSSKSIPGINAVEESASVTAKYITNVVDAIKLKPQADVKVTQSGIDVQVSSKNINATN